jgi:hypothetical protein
VLLDSIRKGTGKLRQGTRIPEQVEMFGGGTERLEQVEKLSASTEKVQSRHDLISTCSDQKTTYRLLDLNSALL